MGHVAPVAQSVVSDRDSGTFSHKLVLCESPEPVTIHGKCFTTSKIAAYWTAAYRWCSPS